MKVKDIIKKLKDLDPEMDVNTNVSKDCCGGDHSNVYGIEITMSVETLYEYNDYIYTEEEDVLEAIEFYEGIDDEEELKRKLLDVPVSEQLVIRLAP